MDRFNQRQQLIINSIWFNSFWFSCVFGGLFIQLPLLAIGVVLMATAKPDYKLTFLALILGLICDFALYKFGVHQFLNEQFPLWLLLLWVGFSFYVGLIHQQVRRLNPIALIAFVSIVTPISYAYGTTIGKIHWPLGIGISYVTLACAWFIYGTCLITIRYHLSTPWFRPTAIIASTIGVLLWPPSIAAEQSIAANQSITAQQQNVQLPWKSWQVVGKAELDWLFWRVYESTLFTPNGEYQQNQPLALSIEYKIDIDKEDLLQATDEQWQHLKVSKSLRQKWLNRLNDIWPDIKEGDKLTFLLQNNYGKFYFNQNSIGRIDDAQLAQNFIAIWLSEQTEYPKLRRRLIGASS